jgi:MarR family 2-MHQ and catechol resistance regulon transcriptional repressor
MTISGVTDPAVVAAARGYIKLLRASRAVVQRVEPRLAAAGLTVTQLGVLEAILHKGPMTHRDLGRKVLTSAGNMTDVVDKLEARGLVLRVRAADDRRQVRVELTPPGRTMIADLFPRHAADIAEAMGGLDAAELEQLGALLRKLGMAAALPTAERGLAAGSESSHLTADRSASNEDRSEP